MSKSISKSVSLRSFPGLLASLVLSALLAVPAAAQQDSLPANPYLGTAPSSYGTPSLGSLLPPLPQLGAPLYIPIVGMPVPLIG